MFPLSAKTNELIKNVSTGATVTSISLAVLTCVFLAYQKKHSKLKGLKEVPSPKGSLPYFGHLFSLKEEIPIAQFDQWHRELGPLVSVKMGVKQWILVSDPNLAYELFNVNGRYSSERPYSTYLSKYYALNCKGLTSGNPCNQWKKTRAAVIHLLSPKNREPLEKLHFFEADTLIKSLLETTQKQGSVNVHVSLQLTSLNVILSTCFNKRANSINDPLFKDITSVIRESLRRGSPSEDMSSFLPVFTVFDFLFGKRKNMQKFINEKRDPLFGGLIKEAIDSKTDCFATSLLDFEDVKEYDNLLVTMSDIIFAGTDTTAVVLSWSMVLLCRHPHVQKQIRDELDLFIAKHRRLPTFDERESFPYSNSVQKECIRLRPATPFGLLHEVTHEFECNGYRIPKGSSLVSNMHAMHHNENIYPNPDTFIPERFIDHNKPMYVSANGKIEDRDHFIFGWGRRTCPGAYLAELEIFNVWVRLFAKCVIEPAIDENGKAVYPDYNTLVNGGIVTIPNNPSMRIVERTDALL